MAFQDRVIDWARKDAEVFVATMVVFGDSFMSLVIEYALDKTPRGDETSFGIALLQSILPEVDDPLGSVFQHIARQSIWIWRLGSPMDWDDVASEGLQIIHNAGGESRSSKFVSLADSKISLNLMPYTDYLQSPHWRETRKKALDRAGNKCLVCNAEQLLQVHHRTYERRGFEDQNDLAVMCAKCHQIFHENRRVK